MIQYVKFRKHVIVEIDDELGTAKFHLEAPEGIPRDAWNDVLVAQLQSLARNMHSQNRVCHIYDFKRGKFVVANPT